MQLNNNATTSATTRGRSHAPRIPSIASAAAASSSAAAAFSSAAASSAASASAAPIPPSFNRSWWSLTSRTRPPIVHGVRPRGRYDPHQVLAHRSRVTRGLEAPSFQRRVPARASDPLDPPPLTSWMRAQAEAQWTDVSVYPALHNDRLHPSKKALFSKPAPESQLRRRPATSAAATGSEGREDSPASRSRERDRARDQQLHSFRPRTDHDPLLRFLETSWRGGESVDPSAQNAATTRLRRRFFDSPPRTASDAAGADADVRVDHDALNRALVCEGQRALTARAHTHRPKMTRSPTRSERERASMRARALAAAAQDEAGPNLLDSFRASSSASPSSSSRSRSPTLPLPFALRQSAATDPASLLASSAPPPPSNLTHPHAHYFRYIPGLKPQERVVAMKREREWNERHQLTQATEDGW